MEFFYDVNKNFYIFNNIIHHLNTYASAYGNTAKAIMAIIEKKFFILKPFIKLSKLTRKILRLCYGIVKRLFILSILNGYTTRAASQSSKQVRIVLLSKNFSRGLGERGYGAGA